MEVVEKKRRSRGGFLNLFDWPGKSRKKLFSSNSAELSEESKLTKPNAQNLSKSQLSLNEIGKNSLRSDSSCCASSVTSDDGQGTRAPSVVARLMGLESIPIPNIQEPPLNPDLDPFFLRPSRNTNKWNAYENLGYVSLRDDYDGISWDHLDSRMNNGCNRSIERFQSETFPPRLAKPICITNNRLLSPIRSPRFVPSKNPIYVMEAASRMIKPSPTMVTRKRFSPSDSHSSGPMRIRGLREKLESSQKVSSRQSSCDTIKNKEKRTSTSVRTPSTGQRSSDGLKGKVKPTYVSAQAKVSTSTIPVSVNRSERQVEAKKRVAKSQNGFRAPSITTGKSVSKQKQNCRDNQPSRVTAVSNQKSSKVYNKVVKKVPVESRSKLKQSGLTAVSTEKNTSLSLSRKKTLPRNKKSENVIKCNITIDGGLNRCKEDMKKDMDVISFTFSSPIKGLSSDTDSAVSFDMIGGDSLNVLLEQKLRELTSKLESSSCSLTQEEPSSSISKDRVNKTNSSSLEYEKSTRKDDKDLSESESVSDCTSFYDKQKMTQEEEDEISSISTVTEPDDFRTSCRHTPEYGSLHEAQDESDVSESVITLMNSEEAEEKLDWELEYISKILLGSNQLMVKEFALGVATDILSASLFDEIEGQGEATAAGKVKRKTIFDFINKFLALKCEQMCRGRKGGFLLEQRDLLAEEVNREIHELKKMREMKLDELAYKDMSSFEGRWLDFEKEMYEEGIEIEGEIVSTLVDDIVDDLVLMFKGKN